jgi:Na+-transporting NADH:ubiquinone oxidoreductase subunit NqrD
MADTSAQPIAVQVVGVRISFVELVVLLVKLALAMIPALFIITAVSAFFWALLGSLFGHHGASTSL